MIRVVHLLDDFAMGGVTRALSLFEDERILGQAASRVVRMGRGISPAPHLDCDLIVIHVPPCWSRLPYLAALRLRNPHARIVQVEHSYTRAFEELKPKIWITGIRKEETAFRQSLDVLSWDGRGILKVAPIFYWSEDDVQAFMDEHALPSCKHYFDPTKVAENRECGLHTSA